MSTMRIVTTGPEGIPGAAGLEFGRGAALDEDGNELEVHNPLHCPVAPGVVVVAGRVHVSQWVGEAWCVLNVGCKVAAEERPAVV
jgi:hypothetical protein